MTRTDLAFTRCDVSILLGGRSGSLRLLPRAMRVLEVLAYRFGYIGMALMLFGSRFVSGRRALCRVRRALAGSLDPPLDVLVHSV